MTITAAADGSSLGNPGPAGWAWYVDENTWDAGGWPQGTNNIGELTAILRLLEATAETGEELHILADSQYAINVVSKWRLGWKKRGWTKADKKPIKNLELIQEIDRAMEGRRVTFEWVKGHAGHRMNERADDLARACAEAYQAGRTPEPGPGFGGGGARVSTSATQANEGEADAPTASPSATPHDATAADGPATASSSRGSSAEDTAPSSAKPAQPQGTATSNVPATESPSHSASANDAGPATTASAAAPAFRSHPSVFSVSTQARGPAEEATASSTSEASESAASVSTADALAREHEFILAWTGGDEAALAAMTDARTTRIWPGGAATTTLGGPSPASPSVGRIDVQDLGGAFLTRYRVRWEGGASLESSVWAPATSGEPRLVMVHHQSTLIG